jgi:hypothetical protein
MHTNKERRGVHGRSSRMRRVDEMLNNCYWRSWWTACASSNTRRRARTHTTHAYKPHRCVCLQDRNGRPLGCARGAGYRLGPPPPPPPEHTCVSTEPEGYIMRCQDTRTCARKHARVRGANGTQSAHAQQERSNSHARADGPRAHTQTRAPHMRAAAATFPTHSPGDTSPSEMKRTDEPG